MYEKLNVKKVVIAALIGILLIISIIVFAISRIGAKKIKEEGNNEAVNTVVQEDSKSIFTDVEDTVSIELDKKYNLVQSHNSEYLIKVSSDEDVDIYISKLEGFEGRELSSIARADKLAYLESYNSYSNPSDLKELS